MTTETQDACLVSDFPSRALSIADDLRTLKESNVRARFELADSARLLKTTVSVCGRCVAPVAAAVVEQNGRVLLHRCCEQHGRETSVLENDARYYRISSRDWHGRIYADDICVAWPEYAAQANGCCGPGSCGARSETTWVEDFHDQRNNKSCTVLVEITNACNLACRVCYADSRGDRILSMEAYQEYVSRLVEQKGGLDSVQITGGEAMLHPQFWELLDWTCRQDGIAKVYLPTNGIEFSKPENALRLKQYRNKILVLLQLDGRDAETNKTLRAANPLKPKQRLIKLLDNHGISMQLTMTLAQDVSETEIAWVVRQGLRHENVRLVAILPAFFTGRYEIATDPMRRMTLSDAVKGVATGLAPQLSEDDFMAIPCSHPNCGWTTLFVRRFGFLINISKHVDQNAAMTAAAYRTTLGKREIRGLLGSRLNDFRSRIVAWVGRKLIRPCDVFGVVIKPFMDRYTFDYDRVANCCHHMLDTQGRLISFCEYNVRKREQDDWQNLTRMDTPARRNTTAGGKAFRDD